MKNEPAFPCEWAKVHHTPGMTLRDYFAAKAMTSTLTGGNTAAKESIENMATHAYRLADAMMEVRNAT